MKYKYQWLPGLGTFFDYSIKIQVRRIYVFSSKLVGYVGFDCKDHTIWAKAT